MTEIPFNEEPIEEIIQEQSEWIKKGYPSENLMNWFESENDYHLLRSFHLNENSLVVDIGCYNGTWLKDMYCKYGCRCIGVEPVPKFYEQASRILCSNKIQLHNFGLCTSLTTQYTMDVCGDGSRVTPVGERVRMKYAPKFFGNMSEDIDVLQINIEGYEYELLPFMIEKKLLKLVKNIQIQFHDNVADAGIRMDDIISSLEGIGFKTKFNHPFIWYGGSRD